MSYKNMKLMTKDLENKIKKYPLGSQDGLGGQAKVIVKYFNPVGMGTWLIIEGNKRENNDYELFGYCNLGYEEYAELGYVMLSELENLNLPFGMKVERDLYLKEDITLKEALEQSGFKMPEHINNEKQEECEEEP
ncbi:MAG: DUF2958 domain-containing protein [Clostridia bacterium]|nr:DUF2958 domain-containing protein [Clostridia bacterium]